MEHLPPSEFDLIFNASIRTWHEHNRVDDPKLIPQNAILAGTIGAQDRSRQYKAAHSPEELLRAVNEAWAKIRANEAAIASKEEQIADLNRRITVCNVKNAALISVLTGLSWEGVKAVLAYWPR